LGGLRNFIRKKPDYNQQDSTFSKLKLWNGLQNGGSFCRPRNIKRSDQKMDFYHCSTVYREKAVQIQPEHPSPLCTASWQKIATTL
jgi:hypothetical protein